KRDLVNALGGFRSEFDGAQDYDLVLRASERARRICHVRRVLYHWRSVASSTSRRAAAKPYGVDGGRRAVEAALERRRIAGTAENGNLPNYYRVRRALRGQPLVSVIVPFRDRPELLERCLDSVLSRTTYRNLEIVGISNQSREA